MAIARRNPRGYRAITTRRRKQQLKGATSQRALQMGTTYDDDDYEPKCKKNQVCDDDDTDDDEEQKAQEQGDGETDDPTPSPTTPSPTIRPTTESPSISPTTDNPTATESPTISPTTPATVAPTTPAPTVEPTTQAPVSPDPTTSPTTAAPVVVEGAEGDPITDAPTTTTNEDTQEPTAAPIETPVPTRTPAAPPTSPEEGAPRPSSLAQSLMPTITTTSTSSSTSSSEDDSDGSTVGTAPTAAADGDSDGSVVTAPTNAADGTNSNNSTTEDALPYAIRLEPLYMYVIMQGDTNEEGFMEVLVDYMEFNMARDFEGFQTITYGVSVFSMITKYPAVSRQSSSSSFQNMTPTSNVTVHIHLLTATFDSKPDEPDLVVTEYMEMLLENEAMMQEYVDSQPNLDITILNVTLEFEDTVDPTDVQDGGTTPNRATGDGGQAGEATTERKDNTMTIVGWTVGSFFVLLWVVYLFGVQSRPTT